MSKCAVIFPGQASQYAGMGQSCWSRFKEADEVFRKAEEILKMDIKSLCLDEQKLKETKYAQICIFVSSVAWFKVLTKVTGYKFKYFAGHSIGEYAAFVCAGCLDFETALKLVKVRGDLMGSIENTRRFAMANIRCSDNSLIINECRKVSRDEDYVDLICDNSSRQKIIAGCEDMVKEVILKLNSYGIRGKVFNSLGAFHTAYLQKAGEEFSSYIEKVKFNKLENIVMSNYTGRPYLDEKHIYPLLKQQMTNMVRWREIIDYLNDKNVDTFIEAGPGTVLRNILIRSGKNLKAEAVENADSIESIINILK